MKSAKLANQNEIIMVDDDQVTLMAAIRYLRKSSISNPVLTFSSGEDLLTYMQDVKAGRYEMPSIILLDVRMPTMDGFEVLDRVRSDEKFKVFPSIVMFSNSETPEDAQKAYEKGANGFQTKFSSGQEFLNFYKSLIPTEEN